MEIEILGFDEPLNNDNKFIVANVRITDSIISGKRRLIVWRDRIESDVVKEAKRLEDRVTKERNEKLRLSSLIGRTFSG